MKKLLLVISVILMLSFALSGCKKEDSSTNAEQLTDNLTLGTGLNSSNLFQLVGEGTTFRGPTVVIYWRLESKDDMAGSAVNIKLERQVNGVYALQQTIPYNNPQSYGHIMLSTFPITQSGNYRATGILATPNKTVATREFVVQ